jgi:hypothetical protein
MYEALRSCVMPARLIPPPVENEDIDVDEYFQSYYSDYDADSELSDDDM